MKAITLSPLQLQHFAQMQSAREQMERDMNNAASLLLAGKNIELKQGQSWKIEGGKLSVSE